MCPDCDGGARRKCDRRKAPLPSLAVAPTRYFFAAFLTIVIAAGRSL